MKFFNFRFWNIFRIFFIFLYFYFNKRLNNISGYTWYEKIINSIDLKDLGICGFSEFETYGTFVNEYYKKTYDIRSWKSLRPANIYYKNKKLTGNDILILAKNYDAVSFENWE